MGYLNDAVASVRAINTRYRTPRIPLSPATKIVLMVLRVYLLALVTLLLVGLFRGVH